MNTVTRLAQLAAAFLISIASVQYAAAAAAPKCDQPRPLVGNVSSNETIGYDPIVGLPFGHTVGTGCSTLTGKFTVDLTDYIIPVGFSFISYGGVVTVTAADGATLYGTYAVQVDPTPTAFLTGDFVTNGTFTITGGTGRFTGATGAGTIIGAENLWSLVGNFAIDGQIQMALALPAAAG
jgi:hypothetical protein